LHKIFNDRKRGIILVETEKDIIAALLKIVRNNELIPEATYHGSMNKLFCTFDAGTPTGYDRVKKKRGST